MIKLHFKSFRINNVLSLFSYINEVSDYINRFRILIGANLNTNLASCQIKVEGDS